MGRHRSDTDDDMYSRSKKKKKRRSRSRSVSHSSDSSRSYKSRKKSKKSRRRRSRSNSYSRPSISRSKSRSPRRHKHSSRTNSPRRRSRSISPRRRSISPRRRSLSPRRRSRSPRRESPRRSRSRSPYRRLRSRSRSPRRRSRTPRRRSRSPRRRSRSPRRRSRSRDRRSRSSSRFRSKKSSRGSSEVKVEPGKLVLPSKQAELKLQLALRAAALADEKLKEAGLLPEGVGRSLHDMQVDLKERHEIAAERAAALESIEDEGFSPAQFTSSRNTKPTSGSAMASHENAIFGSLPLELADIDPAAILKAGPLDPKTIMHPNLYVPVEEKMERWHKKLLAMRNRKLEGEAM